jgi:hypothetical protein
VHDYIGFKWGIQIKYLKHVHLHKYWIWQLTCNSTYCKYKVLDININLLFFLIQSAQGIVSNMGCVSKSQYIEIQNPKKSPFNNMDLVWKKNVRHGEAHIIKVECAYIPHAWILEFLNDEWNHEDSLMEWNIYKWVPSQENLKMLRIQSHLDHIWYDVLLFTFGM